MLPFDSMTNKLTAMRMRRMMRGLTSRAVAKKIGRSYQAVLDWELGRYPIPDSAKRALAEAYGCSVRNLEKWPLDKAKSAR